MNLNQSGAETARKQITNKQNEDKVYSLYPHHENTLNFNLGFQVFRLQVFQ